MSLYLDANVLVPRLIEEPDSTTVDAYFAANTEELLVSDFTSAEVASALSRLVRMRLLTSAQATAALADFDIWRVAGSSSVEVRAIDVRLADAYVRRFELKLRAPDALHLAIVRRLGVTLVTMDARLANAAQDVSIPFVVPERDNGADPR